MTRKRAKWLVPAVLMALVAACAASPTPTAESADSEPVTVQAVGERCSSQNRNPDEFERGCEDGEKSDCACLVDLYLLSLSAPQMVEHEFDAASVRLINKWWAHSREDYADACDRGDGEACGSAFGMWLVKDFNSYSESKALEYMQKGCDLNDAKSCFFLGSAWRSGYPAVPNRDENKSFEAYKKACDLGHKESCGLLSRD